MTYNTMGKTILTRTLRFGPLVLKMFIPICILIVGIFIGAIPMLETMGMRIRFQEAARNKINPTAWHSAMVLASRAETTDVCYALELYNLDVTDEYKHFRKDIDSLRREIGTHREIDAVCSKSILDEIAEKTCGDTKKIASENLEFCISHVKARLAGGTQKKLTPEQFYRIRSIHGSVHEHLLKQSGMVHHEIVAAHAMTTIETNRRLSHDSYINAFNSMIPVGESCKSSNSRICNIFFKKYN